MIFIEDIISFNLHQKSSLYLKNSFLRVEIKFENLGFFSGKKPESGNKRWHPLIIYFVIKENRSFTPAMGGGKLGSWGVKSRIFMLTYKGQFGRMTML